jgi:hypothetical protein
VITIESSHTPSALADFTLRLSSCRFHGASTSEISRQMGSRKKPLKTMRSQGLKTWLRGPATISNCFFRQWLRANTVWKAGSP